MNFKAPETKQIRIFAVGILLIVGVGIFCCKPLLRRTQQLKITKINQGIEQAKIREQIKKLPGIGVEMKELRNQVGNYHKKIPYERDFASLWDQIAEVMNSIGLKDQLIQPEKEVLGDKINSIEVTIKCGGSSAQLFDFFQRLSKFERVVRIEQLKMTNSNKEPGYVTMNAQAKIYYKVSAT
jgi:Tfp pilus assembly protein PilO